MSENQSPGPGGTVEGALWGGRFASGPSPELARLSRSVQFDWKLADYDLRGSIAHAKALAASGFLSESELEQMTAALEDIRCRVAEGAIAPLGSDEDVHGALERELIAAAGPELGGKLRAGRSRNDQIATLIRLYLLDHEQALSGLTTELIRALIGQVQRYPEAILAGRTHLQHAQPVLLSHQLLAHAWPLLRDLDRFADWRRRANESPYGAGALAGSTLGLDPRLVAKELGLAEPSPNSIDATSARDVVSEFCYIAAQIGVDLSRLAEEIIIWNSREFGYLELDDRFSTGSSIMPQKKNPDVAELARGKAGRLIGNLAGLMTTLKGLPLAYNRDLQEDKEAVFDSIETLEVLLPAFTGMVSTISFNTDRMREMAGEAFSLATDVAEWLVRRGVPFRDAHEITGALVRFCEERGLDLSEVKDADLRSISPALGPEVRGILSLETSVASRDGVGGTAPARVAEQLAALKSRLESLK
ncbi:MAG: argininosuccinate lyase [Cryobacterium sp.]|nr:argininosuccinate lyase [Cryobacterium sp.]MCO5294119.1 argininosuccinate lyase [Homoserinimonas sp.]